MTSLAVLKYMKLDESWTWHTTNPAPYVFSYLINMIALASSYISFQHVSYIRICYWLQLFGWTCSTNIYLYLILVNIQYGAKIIWDDGMYSAVYTGYHEHVKLEVTNIIEYRKCTRLTTQSPLLRLKSRLSACGSEWPAASGCIFSRTKLYMYLLLFPDESTECSFFISRT